MDEMLLIIIFVVAILGEIVSEILGDTTNIDEEDTK